MECKSPFDMSLTIQKLPFSSVQDLFEKTHLDGPLKYALELKQKRYFYSEVPDKEKKIGTIDATSCLGVIYKAADHALYVQHLDGRPLDSLLEILDSRSFQVTLIGGCKMPGNDSYSSLEKHTKENLENLVKFWKTHLFNIDVQGWAIGDGPKYETLCSDFIVGEEKIYLMQQGEIGKLNLKMDGNLIPGAARRAATILLEHSRYFLVSISKKILELPGLKNIEKLKQFAQMILELDDETLLKNYSTTPDMEPPYFPQMMRNMASYILQQKGVVAPVKISLLEDHPVFVLQGEIVKLHSY